MKFLLFFLISFTISAKTDLQINKKMVEIAKPVRAIAPFIFERGAFSKIENNKKIQTQLKIILKNFKSTKAHFDKKEKTYQIAHKVMTEHLEDTLEVFENGNKDFSQLMFRSSINLCMSCHTKDHERRKIFPSSARSTFNSDLSYAEFSYITRNYSQALRYYKQVLNSRDQNKVDQGLVLKRILSLYTQVFKDDEQSAFYFKSLLEDKKIKKIYKNELKDWISSLNNFSKEKNKMKNNLSWNEIESKAKEFLLPHKSRSPFPVSSVDQVVYYRLRGILNNYLMNATDKEKLPYVYYWLALSDKALNFDIFYSLGNLYLKECMISHTKSPIALKCLEEYEDQLLLSYTGSGGLKIPKDEELELEKLKALFKKKN